MAPRPLSVEGPAGGEAPNEGHLIQKIAGGCALVVVAIAFSAVFTVVSGASHGVAAPPPAPAPEGFTDVSITYNIKSASNGAWSEKAGQIQGVFPVGSGPFPLFIWLPGEGEWVNGPTAEYFVQQMAERGFAAVAVQYPDTSGTPTANLEANANAVAGSHPHSALSTVCAERKVDCSKGVATAGYSQGALIAALLPKQNASIKAAYMVSGARPNVPGALTICDEANIGQYIPKTKRRYIMGECDTHYAWPSDGSSGTSPTQAAAEANLKLASGYDCGSKEDCFQEDGSGYRVNVIADTGDGSWFGRKFSDAMGWQPRGCPDHHNWASGGTSGFSPWKGGMERVGIGVAAWFEQMNKESLDWLKKAALHADKEKVLV